MEDTKYSKTNRKNKKRRKYDFSDEIKVEEVKEEKQEEIEKPVVKKKITLDKDYTIGKRYVVKSSSVPVMVEPSSKETSTVCKLSKGEQVVCRQVKKNSEGIWINNGIGWLNANTSNGKVCIG